MKLERQETDIEDRKEDVKSLEHKIRLLKRMREIKLHNDTIKKIHQHGYRPGQMTENKGKLCIVL